MNIEFVIKSYLYVSCLCIYLFITFSPYKYISTEMKCPPSTSTRKKEVNNMTKMENTKEMNLNTTLQYMYIKDRT